MGFKTQWAESWARRATHQVVLGGPFLGLQYGRFSVNSGYAPKLLGIYEREVGDFVEALIARKPQRIVNVGAAEGYYAVGLAQRLPEVQVMAYEAEAEGQTLVEETAALNGVGARVEVRGACDPQQLANALGDGRGCAVVMDVESYEGVLLDPEAVPGLTQAAIFVEVHLSEDAGLERLLRGRFEATHTIEKREVRVPALDEVAAHVRSKMKWLPRSVRAKALDEKRSPQDCWLWLQPQVPAPVTAGGQNC
ncbi:MAG: hypothetical protein ACFBZ8_13865 [Opitutales bacterium]